MGRFIIAGGTMRRARFRWWPLLLWSAVIVPRAFGAAGDNIFTNLQVHTVAIDLPQPAYWDSLTLYYNQGLGQYMAARVTVDGVPYDSVGVRFSSSMTHRAAARKTGRRPVARASSASARNCSATTAELNTR